jgi:hypothetical protein
MRFSWRKESDHPRDFVTRSPKRARPQSASPEKGRLYAELSVDALLSFDFMPSGVEVKALWAVAPLETSRLV